MDVLDIFIHIMCEIMCLPMSHLNKTKNKKHKTLPGKTFHILTRILLVLLLFVSWNKSLIGQATLDTLYYDFDVLGVDEGVSAGLVYKVAQDKKGYLWLATTQGLNRYDGYTIKEFKYIPGDTLSLPESHVRNVFVDSRGWLWVGTENSGIFLFDYLTERFIAIGINHFAAIQEDKWGNIWINGPGGKWQIVTVDDSWEDLNDFQQIRSYLKIKKASDVFKGLPEDKMSPAILLSDLHGIMWEGQDSLYAYDLYYSIGMAKPRFKRNIDGEKTSQFFRFNTLMEDLGNEKIYYFGKEQYHIIDPDTGESIHSHSIPASVSQHLITPRMIDSKGRIWAHGLLSHVFIIDPVSNHFLKLKKTGVEGVVYNWQLACEFPYQDKDDNIWLPTIGIGVYKYNLKSERFNYFGYNHEGPSIPHLYELGPNRILFNDYNATKVFDVKNRRLEDFWNEQWFGFPLTDVISPGFFVGPDSHVWVVFGDGDQEWLYQCDTLGKPIQKYPNHYVLDRNSFGILFSTGQYVLWSVVAALDYDELNNYSGLKLYRWDRKHDVENSFEFFPDQPDFLFGDLRSQVQTTDNKIWLGMRDGGLVTFQPETGTWEHFYHQRDNPHSISDNRILCLFTDPQNPDSILWVGTTNGLNKMNIRDKTFVRYSTKDGLPNDVIYGILADDQHNFWISTNRGLCRFNPSTLETRTYTKKDGLQHNEFNKGAFLKTQEGTLFFGGVGGLNWFDPEDFYTESAPSTIVINSLKIINQEIEFSRHTQEGSLNNLGQPIEYTDQIVLNYKDRMISFGFALLDLSLPGQNRYKYYLKGFDDDWIKVNSGHEAIYTNLASGSYTFQVLGQNSEQIWNTVPASIDIKVLPPWWDTWWFTTMIVSLLLLGVYFLYDYRLRQKEKLFLLRERISKDLHDEIGSTLSSISLFGTVAQKKIDQNNHLAVDMLKRINESTTRVMESINDIVWAIKSDNDTIKKILFRMRAYTSELTEASNWKIHYLYEENILSMDMSMVVRRNIYLIFKEAVTNAIKYSGGNEIWIEFEKNNEVLTIRIRDNGMGFDLEEAKNKLSLGGNGLMNMEKRVDELGGSLEIQSGMGKGTTVSVSIAKNHLNK
jgi:signal transduction histidine kinase